MQAKFYPKSPQSVPADLTVPNKKFKKHVWIASIALVLFMFLYFGLSWWFLYKSYKLFANTFTGGRDGGISFIYAVLLGFLGVFMFKALFFITKRDKSNAVEIKKEDEPELFNFIYQIADEAKAPRPHKVFVSTAVNASVFYDISVINLIFPTRKNLEIGLGLVNTLNLAEFKSILAHEFGHFAQRSMIIGRWVYIAHKVAYQIVAKRDGFDNFLSGLSRTDLRVAWIGWLLSIIIWSIRSISETFFKLVLITQRALSREMEFHADLVAVSLTGSDSLVHSLYKLNAADEAYEEAITFVNKQLKKKKAVSDIFSIQSNAIKHMAVVLNNPSYGISPKIEGNDGSKFKVFKEKIAQAPKMWSTHPANIDREKNAKTIYIRSEVDERSSWILFKDNDAIKNKLTLTLYTHLKIETTPLPKEESLELHNKEFERSFLLPKYRGVYLGRDILLPFKKAEDVYDLSLTEKDLAPEFLLLYPESLQGQLSHLKNLKEELELLEGINNKVLDANEGKINYRDKEINRKQLPEAIEEVKKEVKVAISKINEYDRFCRNLHHKAAKRIGNGWLDYLVSLTTVIHYCEHTRKNIEEHARIFYETLAVATKIVNVSDADLLPLFRAADTLYSALEGVFTNGKKIRLSQNIIDNLEIKEFDELLQPFALGHPNRENINSWINVLPGWINLATEALITLKEGALDELLKTEGYVEATYLQSVPAAVEAPSPIYISDTYSTFDENVKQEVTQKPDLISRIYNADGIYPTVGRLTAAAAVIFFAMFFSGNIAQNNIVIYNGLPIDVIVRLNELSVPVPHDQSKQIFLDETSKLNIKTSSIEGEMIETFSPKLSDNSNTYLYNIASAALLYKWKAFYGMSGSGNNNYTLLGAKQWVEIDADHYFEEPPESVSLKSGQTEVRDIVSVYNDHPTQLVSAIKNEFERTDFITAHTLWEKSNSPYFLSWLNLAVDLKTFPQILQARLKKDPYEIASLRMQQDFYKGTERAKYCKQHQQMHLKDPENPDLYYLNIRSLEDGLQQNEAFIAGYKKWPDNQWLAYSSAHCFIQLEDWENAIACFNVVNEKAPELREAILEEMKRVCHLLKKDSLMLNTNQGVLPYLNFVNAVENSEENKTGSLLFAYKLIANGNIRRALEYTSADSSLYTTIIRLAAVSNGATQEIVSKALALPLTKDIDKSTLIPAIALRAKNNLPVDDYTEYVKTITSNKEADFFDFIKYVKANKINEADKLLLGMRAEMKGKTSLLGLILLGNKAPEKWKRFASGLLFINEKPYLDGLLN